MKKKFSKAEISEKIKNFFLDVKNKTPSEIWNIKKLAMKNKINMKDNRKKFCKKCFTPYKNSKVRIKSGKKTITCNKCGYISRWKLN